MFNESLVQVEYSGNVRHQLFERHSRPIRKGERCLVKRDFACGLKPYKFYLDALINKSGSAIMASNFDGLGASNSVLRKISRESHQCDRLHKDMFECLLRFQIV